jgi:hypothetical protein
MQFARSDGPKLRSPMPSKCFGNTRYSFQLFFHQSQTIVFVRHCICNGKVFFPIVIGSFSGLKRYGNFWNVNSKLTVSYAKASATDESFKLSYRLTFFGSEMCKELFLSFLFPPGFQTEFIELGKHFIQGSLYAVHSRGGG